MPTKDEIKDRKTVTANVAGYMKREHPAMSIDTLLTRPTDAMEMGVTVAHAMERITAKSAGNIRRLIKELIDKEDQALEAVDEVCRIALSSRKRGDLRQVKR